jgi:GH24 family phage-related lysozyme (muramidase)
MSYAIGGLTKGMGIGLQLGRDMQQRDENTALRREELALRRAELGVGDSRGGFTGAGAAGGDDPTLGLIREFEGFRDTPYWDVNAHRTGYGSDTVTMADGSVVPVKEGMKITREDAERDLSRRVSGEFQPMVMKAVGDQAWSALGPQQRAALTSIAYNYGRLPQEVADAVRSGDLNAGASAIRSLGRHNNGINLKRRTREAEIFASGAAPAAAPAQTAEAGAPVMDAGPAPRQRWGNLRRILGRT